MDSTICSAIREHKLIQLHYEWGHRVIEPHAYGVNNEGHELLRAYQVSGASQSHEPVGWKLFRVDEIRRLVLLEHTFQGARRGYKRGDKAMSYQIYCEL